MPHQAKVAAAIRRLDRIEKTRSNDISKLPEVKAELRGDNLAIQDCTDKVVLLSGPAGTGKTYAACYKAYQWCVKYPASRVAMVRKTRSSLATTVMVTMERDVMGYGHPVRGGSTRQNRTSYLFPNKSVIELHGMDDDKKIMSSDYDLIYVCQAEDLHEEAALALLMRIRSYSSPYQQLMLDCNPNAKSHWLYKWKEAGRLTFFQTYHKDNPFFWDADKQDWTPEGKDYVENTLNLKTGVKRKRYLEGLWESPEGAVYPFDRTKHITTSLPPMRRYIAGVDFGHGDAGAMTCVGEGTDGSLYIVEERIMTGQTLDYWERIAKEWMAKYPNLQKFVCDHANSSHIQTFNIHGIPAIKAFKAIEPGIDMVSQRLADNPDSGMPRLYISAKSVREEDSELREKHRPTTLIAEFESYLRHPETGKPIDRDNHGLDSLRYAVAFFDRAKFEMRAAASTHRPLYSQSVNRKSRPRPSRIYGSRS